VFKIMAFTKNDEAVSPVIGVILMVAITVILAAVIAAFVFGMAGNISKTKVVAATVQKPDSTHITVTYQGGQDATSLTNLQINIPGATAWTSTAFPATAAAGDVGYLNSSATVPAVGTLPVGASGTATGVFSGRTHVVVTGAFSDLSQQVILDTYV
jgi:archaeal type IV pilus assembly protein PilA